MKMATLFLAIVSLFFIFKIGTLVREYRYIGGGMAAANTITVSGEGEAFAIPDTATITFTVRNQNADIKAAQDATSAKVSEVLDAVRTIGVADEDIKTTNYMSNPTYKYSTYYGRPVENTITGYEVAETIEVKVRDTAKTADVLAALGTAGVTETFGPNYEVADEDALQAEARKDAIDDAKGKADALAKDLGVRLVRIVSYSENGNYPMYYEKAMDMSLQSAGNVAPAPELPTGQNKITSNVTVTYEIR